MNKSSARSTLYGLLGLTSLLVSILGYLYGHKLLPPESLAGVLTAAWQILTALLLLTLAGALGERLLRFSEAAGLLRFALSAAAGLVILSVGILVMGALLGTLTLVFAASAIVLLVLLRHDVRAWFHDLRDIRNALDGRYQALLACAAFFVLAIGLLYALAPPVEFDALTYHLALPRAYLQQGRIGYQADSMFWGMPQLVEMLYVPLMAAAGAQAAAVLIWMVGVTALLGLFGQVRSLFGTAAAWTAVIALLIGENLIRSLSTAYVDWMSILFGWAALATLLMWWDKQDRRILLLAGAFCGAALGTKYSAGVLMIGIAVAVFALPREQRVAQRLTAALLVVGAAALVSSPWWLKNLLGTGNPFYPFFLPAGAMDQSRLDFYQKVPVWRDWRSVVLLPWQATFLGIDGKNGYAASIGPLLVGLSPLAAIGWTSRTDQQKRSILAAAVVTITGLLIWALGSRVSGLLIQTRLYMVIFPAWAILAAAGLDSVSNLQGNTVRFGRLMHVLVAVILCISVFSVGRGFVLHNPAAYTLRLQDEKSYLASNLGGYSSAMDAIAALPAGSRVLMLWETRGYYCQPRCDSDEVIDRWFQDARLHPTTDVLLRSWHDSRYTDLLVFNLGKDFVREYDYPQDGFMHWSLLEATLAELPVEQQIANGAYTLYKIP